MPFTRQNNETLNNAFRRTKDESSHGLVNPKMARKKKDEEFETLQLPPKPGRADGGDDPDDPITSPDIVLSPRIVLGEAYRSAWKAAQTIRTSNEERALMGVYAELLEAGDIDGAMKVYDRVLKLRDFQADIIALPTRPKGELQNGPAKMTRAVPIAHDELPEPPLHAGSELLE